MTWGCQGCDYGLLSAGAHLPHCRQSILFQERESETDKRKRLQEENPLYTRHTDGQIRAMLRAEHPEHFDPSLRREAEAHGMRSAPWYETHLSEVISFLREKFPE